LTIDTPLKNYHLISDLNPVLATIIFISRVFIQGGVCTLYLFSAELFPTVVRNVGVGAASSFGRIGALLGPQMALLVRDRLGTRCVEKNGR
jgi:OCT family organic cation transporter-like MFS transporter 4/5